MVLLQAVAAAVAPVLSRGPGGWGWSEKCVAGAEMERLEKLCVGTLVPGRVGWSVLY